MRVLVCGGRSFSDGHAVRSVLRELSPSLVIAGGARGADTLAERIADDLGITLVIFPANWKSDGRAAGPIRNARMLKEGRPDLVVAFPGGRGTADMVKKAKAAGIPVRHESERCPPPSPSAPSAI